MHTRLPPKGVCPGSRDILKFWEISDKTSETVQDRDIQGGPKREPHLFHSYGVNIIKYAGK